MKAVEVESTDMGAANVMAVLPNAVNLDNIEVDWSEGYPLAVNTRSGKTYFTIELSDYGVGEWAREYYDDDKFLAKLDDSDDSAWEKARKDMALSAYYED